MANIPQPRYPRLATPPLIGRPPRSRAARVAAFNLHPPGPGRPAKSTAAKVVAVVFSPVGIATAAALLFAVVAIRSSGRADAAEELVGA